MTLTMSLFSRPQRPADRSPAARLAAIRDRLGAVRACQRLAHATEDADLADDHWRTFDAAVDQLIPLLAEAEDAGDLLRAEDFLRRYHGGA
jgi:hypothetical protein